MSMVLSRYYSAEMVRNLPDDGNRYETVFGELLVTPAPRAWHQEVVGRLFESLRAYLRVESVGHAMMSPADISWGPDTLVQPDVFVVPLEQARSLDWANMRTLLLVIEVLSPTTARADRFTKRRLYQDQRSEVYWVVDPDARQVEIWTPSDRFPSIEDARLSWRPQGARTEFVLSLERLFRPI